MQTKTQQTLKDFQALRLNGKANKESFKMLCAFVGPKLHSLNGWEWQATNQELTKWMHEIGINKFKAQKILNKYVAA